MPPRHNFSPLTLLLPALLTGLLTGLVAAAFRGTVDWLLAQRGALAAWLAPGFPWSAVIPICLAAALTGLSFYLRRRWAPETSGSGIPQIEGYLQGSAPFAWPRVLAVKFIGGSLALGAGLVAGFEGPTIQMGGALGLMMAGGSASSEERRRLLVAVGAGAGLAAAFNAPLAGVALVREELQESFNVPPWGYPALFVGCVGSTVALRALRGQGAVISLTQFHRAPLASLWMFAVLGIILGIAGYGFNRLLLWSLDRFDQVPPPARRFLGLGVGALVGLVALLYPPLVGSGENTVIWAFDQQASSLLLLAVFAGRLALTLICYGSGAIGGIFAPLLALATVLSLALAQHFHSGFPAQLPEPAVMAIAGMGALVAATVQAPLTAILLTIEMTDNYFVILPLLITCVGAGLTANYFGARPIYTALLERQTLASANRPKL
ncbi:MAG: H(+)/Cl(-) exchange transporter ClcA [Cyanobacteriota bacterium]|nr:H(+)/Cl(-) exchange transporter ClcA [Cyanobacteriota bacterium]